jgi:signal transduction histidine kinase/ActR/RegA family two-component response regulator
MPLPPHVIAFARLQPEATALLSREGVILYANSAAREALGISSESGSPSLASLADEPAETIADYLRMWARSTDLLPGAFRIRNASTGQTISYSCKGGRLESSVESGAAILVCRFEAKDASSPFLLLNQAIAELTDEVQRRRRVEDALRHNELELRERALEAEAANRIKDEFLAALSHELRTPLNAILGWTLMLRQGLAEEQHSRAIDTIERNTRVQVKLIDELLDVSRIVSGNLRLNVQQLEPIHVVQNALETVRPAADARGVRIHSVLNPLAGPISGDPDRLQQVAWNLLSNAVKYTPRGGRIEVLLERIDSSIEFTVSDDGQGIVGSFLPHVFERFRQSEGGTSRKHGGLGLGLAIAKSIVELHGGTISAASDGDGQGAKFTVRLPRAVIVRADRPSRPFTSASDDIQRRSNLRSLELAGLNVVAVDDEPDGLQLLATILELSGATVRTGRSAEEGLELVKAIRPDVLISDIGMPVEDGYSLIKKVRALGSEHGGHVHAVALTAHARMEDRTRALTAGFHAHVPKPVEPVELLAVIASLARRR